MFRNPGMRALLSVLVLLTASASAHADDSPSAKPVVVLELFTSQGCSSCPPADAYLLELGRSSEFDDVIPLAFHVDYWDYIGWSDPYASKMFSNRQRTYARAWGSGRIYTPQLVVNGRTHVVGSNKKAVQREIERARKQKPKGRIDVAVDEKGALTVDAHSKAPGKVDVMLAVYQTEVATNVKAGENTGRKLKEGYVVRRLTRLGTLSEGAFTTAVPLDLDEAWGKRSSLGAAVILQKRSNREIISAARLQLR